MPATSTETGSENGLKHCRTLSRDLNETCRPVGRAFVHNERQLAVRIAKGAALLPAVAMRNRQFVKDI